MPADSMPWKWTKKRERAARMIAEDELSVAAIATTLGVAPRSVERWKTAPEFTARVTELFEQWKARRRSDGFGCRERRIQSLIEDFNATTTILRERGIDAAWMDTNGQERQLGLPGGATGFIAREIDVIQGRVVKVAKFDAALMKERRELRKQIAQELGEWTEKQELTGKDGGPIEANLSGVPIDRLRQAVEMLNPVKENG